MGNYSISEKSFIETIGIEDLQKLSLIARYFMWQQFYFLEHQAVQIIKDKSENLYNVPADLLS